MGITKWTPEMETELKHCIEQHGWSLGTEAFRALHPSMSYSACASKWYMFKNNGATHRNPRGKARLLIRDNIEFIKEVISENPDNLRRAFNIISRELNIGISYVQGCWYNHENSPMHRSRIGSCFMTVGKRMVDNTKNIAGDASYSVDSKVYEKAIKRTLKNIIHDK